MSLFNNLFCGSSLTQGLRNAAPGIGLAFHTGRASLGNAIWQALDNAASKAEIDYFNRKFDSLSEEEEEELANDEEKFERFVRKTNAELGIYEDEDEDEDEEDDEDDEDEEDEDDEDDEDGEDDDVEDDEEEDDDSDNVSIPRSFWKVFGKPDVENDTAGAAKSGGRIKEEDEKEHLTDERLSRTLRYLSGALAGKVPGYLSDLTALAVLYETGQITLEQVYENMPLQEGTDTSEMVGILNLISITLCGKPVSGTVGQPKAKASEKLNSAVLSVLECMRGYQKILTEDSAKKMDGMMEALQKQKKEKQEKQ